MTVLPLRLYAPDLPDAACHGHDPELWFADGLVGPHTGKRTPATARAKAVCNGDDRHPPCPVRAACLEWALARNERWGVWGGLDAEERKALRRRSA